MIRITHDPSLWAVKIQGPFTFNITPADTTDSILQEDEQSKAFQMLLFNLLKGRPLAKKKNNHPPLYPSQKQSKKQQKAEKQKHKNSFLTGYLTTPVHNDGKDEESNLKTKSCSMEIWSSYTFM